MCESLGTITTITGPVASHHTIRARRFPRPRPFTLRANLKRTFLRRRLRHPDRPSFCGLSSTAIQTRTTVVARRSAPVSLDRGMEFYMPLIASLRADDTLMKLCG